jgi:hypothetical protein
VFLLFCGQVFADDVPVSCSGVEDEMVGQAENVLIDQDE